MIPLDLFSAEAAMVGIGLMVWLLAGFAAHRIVRSLRSAREMARLRRFAEASQEGVIFHVGGVLKDANARFRAMSGYTTKDALERQVGTFFAPASRAVVDALTRAGSGTAEVFLLEAGGREMPVDVRAGSVSSGRKSHSVLAVRDSSDRRSTNELLERMTQFDALTGLSNRPLFQDRMLGAINEADARGAALAVFVIGLDRFKPLNEGHGHRIGDLTLISVAERIAALLREGETLARIGGDEFAIFQVSDRQPDAAALLARRILQVMRRPHDIERQLIAVTASIGVALHPTDAGSAELILSRAHHALERAKQEGRNGICFFDAKADARRQQRHDLEQDLAMAIRRGELTLEYQPLFNAKTLEREGHEALARWEHPRFGRIAPSEFIPLAEDAGLIDAIGRYLLQAACAQAAAWSAEARIAVNLSPLQCRDPGFPGVVAAILEETGLAAGRLELEITEGVLMQTPDQSLAVLNALKNLGLRLVLDDFGTGFSSLSFLRRVPVDKIKIDRSFVSELGCDPEADAVVDAILALGLAMRLDVTAEGVETEAQLEHLRAHGATQVQGYLTGYPAAVGDLPVLPDFAADFALAHAIANERGDAAPKQPGAPEKASARKRRAKPRKSVKTSAG